MRKISRMFALTIILGLLTVPMTAVAAYDDDDQPHMQAALEALQQAIFIKPDYGDAFFAMGIVYNELSDVPKTVASYQQAISLKPGHAQTHYNLSLAYLKIGIADKALDEYLV